jgi:glycosyltransferase involved in cell wall biosynthesis
MFAPSPAATLPIRELAHHDHPGVTRPLPATAPRVSVVIPARNEARNLPIVLSELPIGLYEVILVDGASVDGTIRTARRVRPDIRVLRQTGTGKGNALACGILAATGDIVVTLDADGSADPAEITDFVAVLVDGADYVKGSRFLPGGGSTDLTLLRRAGNAALVFLMNRVYRTGFSDLCYGYNAFWTRCVDSLDLARIAAAEPTFGDGFEIETLLAAHACTARLSVAEVASFERVRRYGESNLRTWRDGRRVLKAILRERRHANERPQPLETLVTAQESAENL